MKKVEKKQLVSASLGALLLVSIQVKAQPQFAVLKTEQSCGINIPDTVKSSSYYFSKDCQTAYILPGRSIPVSVSRPILNIGATEAYCNEFANAYQRAKEKKNLIEQLENSIARLLEIDQSKISADEAKQLNNQIKIMNRQIAIYQDSIHKNMKEFDKTTALTAVITVGFDQTEQVKAFQEANNMVVSSELIYPTRFVPASISNGILAFSGKNEDSKVLGETITDIQFPGAVAQNKDELKLSNTRYVKMNGELSGKISISSSAYCSHKKLQPLAKDTDILASAVAINAGYDVRVQAGAKISIAAKISTVDFLRSLENKVVNGKYTRNEFINHIVQGGLSSGLYIELDDNGETKSLDSMLVVTDEDNASPIATIAGKVVSDFITNSEDKLEQLGIVEKIDEVKAREIPAADVDVQTGIQQICSSSSSWFGLVRNRHCTSHPVFVKVSVDGISNVLKSNNDNSFIEQTVQYTSNETIKIAHNSSFVYVGEKNEVH